MKNGSPHFPIFISPSRMTSVTRAEGEFHSEIPCLLPRVQAPELLQNPSLAPGGFGITRCIFAERLPVSFTREIDFLPSFVPSA